MPGEQDAPSPALQDHRVADGPGTALGGPRQEVAVAREIRARELVAGTPPAGVAAAILAGCGPTYGTTRIRACRLALGIALADVVTQVRAWYEADGRRPPRFSETLLSAYESGQKRPGPEYLHYLCATYRADPPDLGYPGPCLCGRSHRPDPPASRRRQAAAPGQAAPGQAAAPHLTGLPDAPALPAHAGPPGSAAPCDATTTSESAAPVQPALPARPSSPALPVPAQASSADGPAGHPPVPPGRSAAPPEAWAGPPGTPPWPPARLPQSGGRLPEPAGSMPGREVTGTVPGPDEDGDELRRMLIQLMTDASAPVDCQFLGAVDRTRRRMDDALLRGTVSAAMVDRWEEAMAGYGRRYMTVAPLRLLCDALLDFGEVRRMCELRQPLEFSERLCRLAGQLAGLAGILLLDLGDQRLSRSFFRTARTAADETGDRRLRAWVTAREALVPLYYGDPREAARLASAATDLAGRRPCVAGVMGTVIEARAQARMARLARRGSRASRGGRGLRDALDRGRAALERSHDALGELPAAETADTAFGYTDRQFFFHAGDALAMLGDHQEAQRAFSQAQRLYPAAEVLDASLVTFGQARCLADADQPEQALRLAKDTLLGLPPEQRTEIIWQVARGLGAAVRAAHPGLRAAADYQDALRAASAGATAAGTARPGAGTDAPAPGTPAE